MKLIEINNIHDDFFLSRKVLIRCLLAGEDGESGAPLND